MALVNVFGDIALDATVQDVVTAVESIDAGTPAALGSTTGSGSMPVVIASDQAAVASKVADGVNVALGATTDASTATTVVGRLQKLVALLNGGLPAALGGGGGLKVDGSGTALPVSGTVTITPSGTQAVSVADGSDAATGTTTDASTANTVIGRLKKLISLLPTALGSATSANSLPVVIASDQAPPALTLTVGERAGATSATQFASVSAKWVKIKAEYDNAGRVYIGGSSVTKAAGTTTTTAGWQLVAGDETPWLPISNLNALYLICDNAGDDVTYMVLS